MFDLLLATALAAILLSAMSTGSGDSSSPRFCRSTSHALSAIREANNGYGEGIELRSSFCMPTSYEWGEDYVQVTDPDLHVMVDVHPGDLISLGDPTVYEVPAGDWIRLQASGADVIHYQRGQGTQTGSECAAPPPCPSDKPVAWHERGNDNHPYQWYYPTGTSPQGGSSYNTGEIPVAAHVSQADEEAFTPSQPLQYAAEAGLQYAVEPGSCECPTFRCHQDKTLWLQMPFPEDGVEPVIDVHVLREPTVAYDEAPVKHIQLQVVHEPTIVERDFYITPSAAAAGFGEDDVYDLVDGVNEMLRSEHDHDPSDEYVGAPRDYDSNADGDLDSSRGGYDRYVPVEFQVGEVTIWNEQTFPWEFNSNLTGLEAIVLNEAEITIAPDDIIREAIEPKEDPVPEDNWWKDSLDKNVVVTKNIFTSDIYVEDEDFLRLVNRTAGVANLDEGQYNTEVVIEHEAGPEALLHEWGHNMGLVHIDPGGQPLEGHSDNHMNPALDVIGPWISEEELELYGQEGVEPNQYQRWTGIP